MELSNRHYVSGSRYRFGFQGQEGDDEWSGSGNMLAFKYRIHDARLGRFLSVDPLAPEYPWNSSYAFSENRVIDCRELEGKELVPAGYYYNRKGTKIELSGEEKIKFQAMVQTTIDELDAESPQINAYFVTNNIRIPVAIKVSGAKFTIKGIRDANNQKIEEVQSINNSLHALGECETVPTWDPNSWGLKPAAAWRYQYRVDHPGATTQDAENAFLAHDVNERVKLLEPYMVPKEPSLDYIQEIRIIYDGIAAQQQMQIYNKEARITTNKEVLRHETIHAILDRLFSFKLNDSGSGAPPTSFDSEPAAE